MKSHIMLYYVMAIYPVIGETFYSESHVSTGLSIQRYCNESYGNHECLYRIYDKPSDSCKDVSVRHKSSRPFNKDCHTAAKKNLQLNLRNMSFGSQCVTIKGGDRFLK